MQILLVACLIAACRADKTPRLPQTLTNGKSLLGTLSAPLLELCLNESASGMSCPSSWLGLGTEWPQEPQGRKRYYNLDVTRGTLAPDGVNSSTLLVNGAFPGPTIEANWGDTLVIRVNNRLSNPEAGTAIHWHGLFQKNSQFMDGVPSVTMCPIAPRESFIYRFRADRVGTSWWHSHFSGQTAGGLFGALIIHGPSHVSYDLDLGPILLSDRYHIDYRDLVHETMAANLIYSDNNLINGKMFRSGKTHLLRLINTGAEALEHFVIDGHNMTVVALDFVPIQPFTTRVVSLSPGQRVNVIVDGVGNSTGSYWMRADIDPQCSAAKQPHALAAIYYENADPNVDPDSFEDGYATDGCASTPIQVAKPHIPERPPTAPSYVQSLDFTLNLNESGSLLFFTNGRTFRANFNEAILANAVRPSFQFSTVDPQANLYDFRSNSSVRMVLRNFFVSPHPMHLHGHDFWILAEGLGEWNGSITNPQNPVRRDTHQMLGAVGETPSYVVIEFLLDNPGVWSLHCHIFSHLALGMYINIAYGKKQVEGLETPKDIKTGCASWNRYAEQNVVEQPDAGLRFT